MKRAREAAGLTQRQAADRLDVSQAYLALLEGGRRRLTDRLMVEMIGLYRLGPTALPIDISDLDGWDSALLAKAIAQLGYPGFRQFRGAARQNPVVILLAAISRDNLEVRVIESLPWLVARYHDLDWHWLIGEAKQRNLQNRLGFVVALARRVAASRGGHEVDRRLGEVERVLESARLAREDTLCQDSLSEAERRWLRRNRPTAARHWNLLTDLDAEDLPYAA